MKRFVPVIFILILASFLYGGDYAAFTAVKTISSDFTLEKHLAIAVNPLISKGKFYFENPGFLRWEYTTPFPSGVILDGKKAFSWTGSGSKKVIKNISSQPLAKGMAVQLYMFVSMDMAEISARYIVRERDTGVTLLPKDQSHKQTLAEIDLTFNAAKNAVTKVEMKEKSGDRTVIYFTSTALDTGVPPESKNP
jgi:outer membrane lipoprotein carrier protein